MFDNHYVNWRNSRIEGIKKYIDLNFFKEKTMLEVGCGYADLGNMFSNFSCSVTSTDARKEHLDEVNRRYPHITTYILDCDKDKITTKYDIILHWGVLYHLSNVEEHLKNVCEQTDYLLLETEVSDTLDKDTIFNVDESGYDQAFNNIGCRPSEQYVEKLLSEYNFYFKMIKDPIINSDYHIYDWDISETKSWRNGLRRYWICWRKDKDTPLKN